MSRQRKQTYRSTALAELTRQLIYLPPDKRAEAVRHAERLHDELEPDKNYPIDFVVYRLTDRRVPPSENVTLVGEAILPDLRLLIDALSRSIELHCDASDPGKTTKELAESLGVSTKTIGRWRDAGLRWRWGMRVGKPAVLITQSAVEAFQLRHADRVSTARNYSRLTDLEKSRVIDRTRRLANATDTPQMAILSHLAKRTGRSVEALRLLVLQHDQEHPDQAVFVDRTGPLTEAQKQMIDRAYCEGTTVSTMCKRFNKTRSTIYRAIHEGRAKRVCSMTIGAMQSPIFERDDADEVLAQPVARRGKARLPTAKLIGPLSDALKAIYNRPIEPDEVVRSLIVRYNFLKYRAARLQSAICKAPPRASELNQFDELLMKIDEARGAVISAILPVTLSIVRRHDADKPAMMRLLWIAHRVLIEQIDHYDPAVAHTFESVLTNRLLRSLTRPDGPDGEVDEAGLIQQLLDAGFSAA